MQPESATPLATQATASDPSVTELDSTIGPMPWLDGFDMGVGVDAVTGGVMGSAIKPPTLQQATTKSSNSEMVLIQTDSEMSDEINAAASGTFNIEGIPVGTSASYLNSVTYSELSATLLLKYESTMNGYDEAAQYELTDDARKLMSDDSASFREAYGDYFVAGGKRIARFTALYTCRASSSTQIQKFAADLDLNKGSKPASASASVSISQAAAKNNIKITVKLFMDGYVDDGHKPNPDCTMADVKGALDWFMQHEQGTYLEAKLNHYNTLNPAYPRRVQVDPGVFNDLRRLYGAIWTMTARFNTCPEAYKKLFQEDIDKLKGARSYQASLPADPQMRNTYLNLAAQLSSRFDDVFDRLVFFQKVQAAAAAEPKKGAQIAEGADQQTWRYGFAAYPQSKVVAITSKPFKPFKDTGTTLGNETHVFEYGPDDNVRVVGWQVDSLYRDGSNGSWTKGIDQILARNHAVVTVQAAFNRCLDWSFTVYTVPAADYNFD